MKYVLIIITGIIPIIGYVLEAKDSKKENFFSGINSLRVFQIIALFAVISFSLWVAIGESDEQDRNKKEADAKFASELDRYSKDSLIRVLKWTNDSANFASQKAVTDSSYLRQRHNDSTQIILLRNQISVGMSVDNIKAKAASIVANLSTLESKLVEGNKELYHQQQRQIYLLNDNTQVNLLLTLQFSNKLMSKDIEENYYSDLTDYVNGTSLLSIRLQQFLKNLIIQIYLPSLNLQNTDGFKTLVKYKGVDMNQKNVFDVSYDSKSKLFSFICRIIPLKLIADENHFLSILDYENIPFNLQIHSSEEKPPYNEYHFPIGWDGTFLGSDSVFAKFQINFINKKRTIMFEKGIVPPETQTFNFEALHFQEGFGKNAF